MQLWMTVFWGQESLGLMELTVCVLNLGDTLLHISINLFFLKISFFSRQFRQCATDTTIAQLATTSSFDYF